MAQEFYINKNATLPLLKMELINDGRTDFNKFYESIQNAVITFSMEDSDTGVVKIANQPALILSKEDTCGDEYFIAYKWKVRDTKVCGKYSGKFKIVFDDIYGGGTLLVPIQEPLVIYIQD